MPNIVYILADDMGIGDIRSYNPSSPVNTPNIDRIANAGMRFTNAHSSSSVCSPTRYSLLTGRYAWRGPMPSNVVGPYGPPIIEASRLTVGEMLQERGYDTAAIGKWHLGMNWVTTNGGAPLATGTNVDHSQPFSGGPVDHGFDTYFGDDVINLPPYTYIRDNKTVGIPVGNPGPYVPPGGNLAGYVTPGYHTRDVLPAITDEAVSYIGQKAAQPNPFFLYFPMTAPHQPIFPPEFMVGSSGVTGGRAAYGDFIATVDWSVGRVLGALEDPNGDGNTSDSILDETMIVFAADNGADTNSSFGTSPGYIDGQLMRGSKATVYEGGHRVPYVTQWNGFIPAGTTTSQLIEVNDFMATVAKTVDYELPASAGEDSYDMTPALFGRATAPLRNYSVQHSTAGAHVIRQIDDAGNEWKLIFSSNDGGYGGNRFNPLSTISDFGQLQMYNLKSDPREQTNLLAAGGSSEMQAKALELQSMLRSYMNSGRSAPTVARGGRVVDPVIRIDFGPAHQQTLATGWNNVAGIVGSKPVTILNLTDTAGQATGIILTTQWSEMTDHTGVNGEAANYQGPYPTQLSHLPQSALSDGIYVREGAIYTMTLSNLKDDHVYDFVIYGAASNTGDYSRFTVSGSTTKVAHITPLINNVTEVASIRGIVPDDTETIVVEFEGRRPNGMEHLPGIIGDGLGRLNFIQIIERLAPLPGDYNLDNFVNGLDYNVWRSRFGSTDIAADGNNDGRVDAADYVVWRNNLGAQRTGSGAAVVIPEFSQAAVPEPGAWHILAIGLLALIGTMRSSWRPACGRDLT